MHATNHTSTPLCTFLRNNYSIVIPVIQWMFSSSNKEQYDCSCLRCFRVAYNTYLIFHPHVSMLHQFQFSLSQVPFVSHEVPPAGQFVSVGSLSLGLAFHENNCQYANMKHSEPLWTHSVTPLFLHNSTMSMSTPRRQWEETYAKTFVKNTTILKES